MIKTPHKMTIAGQGIPSPAIYNAMILFLASRFDGPWMARDLKKALYLPTHLNRHRDRIADRLIQWAKRQLVVETTGMKHRVKYREALDKAVHRMAGGPDRVAAERLLALSAEETGLLNAAVDRVISRWIVSPSAT
jgi:hypothetical protein